MYAQIILVELLDIHIPLLPLL